MRFYIATQLANSEQQQALAQYLINNGHELSFDWSKQDNELKTNRVFSKEEYELHARNDLQGVMSADFLIVLLPGGLGTHVEFGAALAMGKKIIIVGNQEMYGYTCVFYNTRGVVRFPADQYKLFDAIRNELDTLEYEVLLGNHY
jgi:nucleoside 2-deoxyribosyltransferase